jgi:glycosyltransferase involved in cell wall biosynthesis
MPKVSIIVPVYNVEQYIARCLDSLINQTLKDIQIIIVNDGSTDGSGIIAEEYQIKCPEKAVYIEKNNGGLADARNTGMKYAGGDYIGFVDGDDYIENDMYEKLYAKAMENKADLVECDFFWRYTSKQKWDRGEMYDIRNILTKDRVVVWNKIIRRDIIERNSLQFPIVSRHEDVEFFFKLIPFINTIDFVHEPLYYYIQRDTSIIHTQNERTGDIFKIFDNVIHYYKMKGFYDRFKEQLEYRCIRLLLGSSFLRMVRIADKQVRKRLLRENWNYLNTIFPSWKKNQILTKRWDLKDIYFKTVNVFSYTLYARLFRLLYSFL